MTRPWDLTLAQICIGVLLLVIIRALGECFRLQYVHGDAVAVGQIIPYVGGALFAAIALALTVALISPDFIVYRLLSLPQLSFSC
jgi:hypothetical protein